LTTVFVITMSQGKFDLDMELKLHRDALNHGLYMAYKRHRSRLYLEKYKIYFKDVDNQDSVAMTNAKLKAKANAPKDMSPEQWPVICDSFETDAWKVNVSYSNKLKIIIFNICIQL
jgi:hypothetical protein